MSISYHKSIWSVEEGGTSLFSVELCGLKGTEPKNCKKTVPKTRLGNTNVYKHKSKWMKLTMWNWRTGIQPSGRMNISWCVAPNSTISEAAWCISYWERLENGLQGKKIHFFIVHLDTGRAKQNVGSSIWQMHFSNQSPFNYGKKTRNIHG